MPRDKSKGVDRVGMDKPCELCAFYTPFGGERYGGECNNPNSPALYWRDGQCWFTAPNDACTLWIPVQVVSQDGRETAKMFHGASTQDADF